MIKKQREKQYAVFGLGRFGTSVALTPVSYTHLTLPTN